MSADNPAAAGSATPDDQAARRPRSLDDLLAAGEAALAERRVADAVMTYRKAVLLVPKDWRGYERLANLLRRSGRFDEAHKIAERGLTLAPDVPAMLVETAQCRRLLSRGDPVAPLQRACELVPDRAEYYSLLAEAYLETNRQQRPAADALKRALELDPGNPNRITRYAGVLSMIGQEVQAEELLRDAQRLAPGSVEVWIATARFAQIMGRTADAQAAWQRVIALAPDSSDAMAVLLTQFPESVDAALHARALAMATSPATHARVQRRLQFALYAFEKHRANYDVAFRHLAEGNRLRREELTTRERGYGRPSREQYFNRVIETFDAAFFERTKGMGNPSIQPIFILGMPRSGTTLCEQILASHSRVFGAGELEGIRDIARLMPRALARPGETPGAFPFAMDRVTNEIVQRFAGRYLSQLSQLTRSERATDKMPSNYVHVGLIHLLFPNARIIHCIRDAMDNCLSCYEQNFSHPTSWSWDLEDIGHYYGQYRKLMAHWNRALPVSMLEFSYEATVDDFETQARRLLDFCGLDWEPACLDFHRTERPVLTASKGQVRRPIYTSSKGKWRVFERELEPLRRAIEQAMADA